MQPHFSRDGKTKIQKDNLQAALDAAAAGLPVFPVHVSQKIEGKKLVKPLVKWRRDENGQHATTNPEQIKRWWKLWPDALPGAATGGVFVVDLDEDAKKGPPGEMAYRDLGLVPEAADFIVRTPSGGRHLYFSGHGAEALSISGSKIAPNLDTRGEGGFVFAPGAVSIFGEYKIEKGSLTDIQFDILGPVPEAICNALSKSDRSAADQPSPGGTSIFDMAAGLGFIPCDGDRDPWVRILMAIHHGSGGSDAGRALAHGWSAPDPRYSWQEVEAIWRSFGKRTDDLVTVETLFSEARAHGWQSVSADDLDDLPEDSDLGPLLDNEALALLGEDVATVPIADGLTFLRPRDCASASRPYLVKGFIGERDVACVIGAPGVGKSVFAPDLAYAVAQGREFHGRRVKRGKVFYVAAEDHHGMQTRLTALRDRYGDADDLTLVGGVSDLLNTEKGKKWSSHMLALAQAVKAEKPALVVIDTLAMSYPGLEENSAEGMGRVMAVARKLTQWGAAVLLVHHDTKDGSNGLPRGHSLLNGALDVSLHLTRSSSGVVSGRLTKNRNGGTDLALAFRIQGAEIGVDEDGDPITAAIADPVAPGSDETQDQLPPAQNAALASILDMMPDDGSGVDAAEWKRAAQDDDRITSAEKPDARRRAVSQALTNLLRRGKVTISSGRICLPEEDFGSLLDNLEDQLAGDH